MNWHTQKDWSLSRLMAAHPGQVSAGGLVFSPVTSETTWLFLGFNKVKRTEFNHMKLFIVSSCAFCILAFCSHKVQEYVPTRKFLFYFWTHAKVFITLAALLQLGPYCPLYLDAKTRHLALSNLFTKMLLLL